MFNLFKTKTFWTGAVGLIGIIGSVVTGELTIVQGLLGAVPVVQGIFIRNAIQ